MSERRPMEVTYTFTKVDVNYSSKNFLKRFKFGERRSIPEGETPQTSRTDISRPPESSWFDRLNQALVALNQAADFAPAHTIDVQPDFRYPLAYITYSVKELYANAIVSQNEPRVSLFTFIYYCQNLVVATLLFYDLHSRPQKSCHAESFLHDNRSELSDLLFELRVPNFIAEILSHLSPAFDAHQPNLLYIPTLAGFSFRHDFGRLVPPGIFLAAHSIICQSRKDADRMETLRRFYSTKLVGIAGKDYYISNFLGGPYMDGGEVCDRSNWIRQDIEYFVSSGIGDSYDDYCHFSPLDYEHEGDINPYDLMFCHDAANQTTLHKILKSVSRFLQEKEPSSKTLGSLLSSPSGITVMSHFHTSPTLPTCHSLSPPSIVYNKEHSFVDDAQFAGKVRFLSNPTGETDTNRVQFSPLGFEHFDRFVNVRGDIFGFQPYGPDLSSLRVALTLGLTIENGDIDGVTISQPNLRLAIRDNNSHLLQGSLPARVVHAYIPNFEPSNRLILFKRADHSTYANNPVGFARSDMGQIISVDTPQTSANYLADVHIYGGCYTYMAWNRSDEVLPIPDSSIYFWSSYRFVDNASDCSAREVYFYYTLKSLYGNVVNMTKLQCPSWLFPAK